MEREWREKNIVGACGHVNRTKEKNNKGKEEEEKREWMPTEVHTIENHSTLFCHCKSARVKQKSILSNFD
jgi:hypothetical protein